MTVLLGSKGTEADSLGSHAMRFQVDTGQAVPRDGLKVLSESPAD